MVAQRTINSTAAPFGARRRRNRSLPSVRRVRSPRSVLATTLLAAFVLPLAACSSSNSDSQASAKIDACKLITTDAASKVLGTTVKTKAIDTSSSGPGAASMCNYNDGTIHGGFMLIAGRFSRHLDMAKEAASEEKSAVKEWKQHAGGSPTVTDIKGLGEAAYLFKARSTTELHVLSHGASLVFVRTVDASPKVVKQTEALARLALANLQ